MLIRRAVAGDIPDLLPLCRQFHAESPVHSQLPYDEPTVITLLTNTISDSSWLAQVAIDDDDAIIGMSLHYCMVSWFSTALEAGDLAFYVIPEKRGGRAALKLLGGILRWFETSGALRLQQGITTGINDDAAERFFAKMGFERSGVLVQRRVSPA